MSDLIHIVFTKLCRLFGHHYVALDDDTLMCIHCGRIVMWEIGAANFHRPWQRLFNWAIARKEIPF